MNKIYYVATIAPNYESIKKRNPHSSRAGNLRAMFVARSIQKETIFISMGPGYNSGIFKSKFYQLENKISILYLPLINLFIKGKSIGKFFFSFFLLKYLLANVKKEELVILYNCNIFQVIPVAIAKWIKKFQLVLHIEEIYSFERVNVRRFAEKLAIKYADGAIIVNNELIEYINSAKPYLVTRGYSTFNDIHLKLLKNKNLPQIIYSGRFDYWGGIEILLNAIQYIDKPCRLVICGTGEHEKMLKEFNNTNPKVEYQFVGFVDDKQYNELLINSLVGVNPIRSKEAYSKLSFPSKMLQYLEFGCMLVTSNIPAIHTLYELQDYIYFYNNDNPKELGDAINNAITKNFDKKILIEKMKIHFKNEQLNINNFFKQFTKD